MDALKDADTFINELVGAFPEIEEEVTDEDYKGLIGLQIGCLTRFTQKAIDNNDLDMVTKSLNFVEDNIGKVEHKIENSLYISYLGKLNIIKGSKAEKLLSGNLKKVYAGFNNYAASSQNEKLNNFLKSL